MEGRPPRDTRQSPGLFVSFSPCLLVSLSPCLPVSLSVLSRALLIRGVLFLEQRRLAADHGLGHRVLPLGLDFGKLKHDVGHELFDDAAQTARSGVALAGLDGNL